MSPDLNPIGSGMRALIEAAVTAPTPGMVTRRLQGATVTISGTSNSPVAWDRSQPQKLPDDFYKPEEPESGYVASSDAATLLSTIFLDSPVLVERMLSAPVHQL